MCGKFLWLIILFIVGVANQINYEICHSLWLFVHVSLLLIGIIIIIIIFYKIDNVEKI